MIEFTEALDDSPKCDHEYGKMWMSNFEWTCALCGISGVGAAYGGDFPL